jgi:NAD(P)-dependent dehydrogenase (short-subunit alcohol dehydrogenase family)
MRVFVAGGSDTIDIPLVQSLVRAGHQVTATTRSPAKQSRLQALGATAVVVDALDGVHSSAQCEPRRPRFIEVRVTDPAPNKSDVASKLQSVMKAVASRMP